MRGIQTRKLDVLLGYWLRRAQEASFSAFAERVGSQKIWPGFYAIMLLIHENPHINQTSLSHAAGRDKSTLTTSLRQMVNAGLIMRRRDPADRRSFRLTLTKIGEATLIELNSHARAHDGMLDAIVGTKAKAAMLAMLKNLTQRLQHQPVASAKPIRQHRSPNWKSRRS